MKPWIAKFPFVCKLPRKDRKGPIAIRIEPLTTEIAGFWHDEVQPTIRSVSPERPDADWNWVIIEAAIRGFARDGALGYSLTRLDCRSPKGLDTGVPIAVAACIGPWHHVSPPTETGVYCWYLAAAPQHTPTLSGLPQLGRVGEAALDTALTKAFQLGLNGRTWLHSDPRGGERLRDFYAHAGMTALDRSAKLPFLRNNDGNIYFHSPESALEAFDRMRELRGVTP